MIRPNSLTAQTWVILTVTVAVIVAALALLVYYHRKPLSIRGAVIREDTDPRKQSPITNVEISTTHTVAPAGVSSDFSGYFKLTLRRRVRRGEVIALHFQHPDYRTVDLKEPVGDKLLIVKMLPDHPENTVPGNGPEVPISNVFVRYSTETATMNNIGTGTRTFQVENTGNVPCHRHAPCSPDGKWKAALASASLDAGQGNVYRNARVSCIAGPCPFTRIETDDFSQGGRKIGVTVLDWSDTTTFLLQAEVYRYEVSDIVRESYPVIFGDSLNFTLPSAAEGPTLEAELGGENTIFPLGPSPVLSWANCNVRVGKDQSKTYRCELKAGFQFR